MKNKIFILIGLVVCFVGCDYPHFIEFDETEITGKIYYAVNPIDSNDSVLCLTGITSVVVKSEDFEYLSYLEELLTKAINDPYNFSVIYQHDGKVECHSDFDDSAIFYVVKNGNFVSVMNQEKDSLLDSLLIYRSSDGKTTLSFHPYPRNEKFDEHSSHYYIYEGDYVSYYWKDDSPQPFIFDSISPMGDTLLCFDGALCPGIVSTEY